MFQAISTLLTTSIMIIATVLNTERTKMLKKEDWQLKEMINTTICTSLTITTPTISKTISKYKLPHSSSIKCLP
jgi:hypothetical protein